MTAEATVEEDFRDYFGVIALGGVLVTLGRGFDDPETAVVPAWDRDELRRTALEAAQGQYVATGTVDVGDVADAVVARLGVTWERAYQVLTEAMGSVGDDPARARPPMRTAARHLRERAEQAQAGAWLRNALDALHEPDADRRKVLAGLREKIDAEPATVRQPFRLASEIITSYDPLGEPEPRRFWVGEGGFLEVDLRPGRVLGLAAAPGVGKTSLVMQWVFDLLRFEPGLRALVMNVEIDPRLLLDRELARMSGVDVGSIINRHRLDDHRDRIDYGLARIAEAAPRLCFAGPPFSVDTVAAAVRRHRPDVVVLDYIQRIAPKGEHASRIDAIDAVVSSCRDFALDGMAVIAVSAVSRQRSSSGNANYSNLGLASMRGSSELEFGVDDAYLLEPDGDQSGQIIARHVKARHGKRVDLTLSFDGARQSFTAETPWGPSVVFPMAGGVA